MQHATEELAVVCCAGCEAARVGGCTLKLSGEFNYGQFLQGENTPASLVTLKEYVSVHGIQQMKFYLAMLAATMAGILGGKSMAGSLFLTESQGRTFMTGLDVLGNLDLQTPQEVYWAFITRRGELIGLPQTQPDE